MKKLCITTVVDENYKDYIPLFVFSCKRAYPEYFIKIFTRFDYPGDSDAEIVPNYFPEQIFKGNNTIALRFVIPGKEFKDFDYVYTTDIDMLILRENISILDFHLNEIGHTGLCYSNSLRNKHHWKGEESLTGLHFCNTWWYEALDGIMQRYREYLKDNEVNREYDGHMLYLMVKQMGWELPKKYPLVKRHHGIHLGSFRLFEDNFKKIKKRIPLWKCERWRIMQKTEAIRKMTICLKGIRNKEILNQLDLLDKHCTRMMPIV